MKNSFWALPRGTGITLILGGNLFAIGVALPVTDSAGTYIYQLPPRQWLEVVSTHPMLWWWSSVLIIGGTLLTLMGLALLTKLFQGTGGEVFSQVGLIAFAVGFLLWIIDVSFRLSVDPWAAQETVRTGIMPELYTPLRLWIGALFVIFTILAFAAIATYGAAVLFSRLLPRWLGWAAMVYAVAGLGVLAYAHDFLPFGHYLALTVIGVALVLRRNRRPAGQQQAVSTSATTTAGR